MQNSKCKILAWALLFIVLLPSVAFAQSGTPTSTTGFENLCARGVPLPNCIQNIYLLSLGLGSVIALFMLVLAGYKYMTAAGNAQQVESAKESFAAAFIGLIIIFIAFILLNLINPDLVRFRSNTNQNFVIPPPKP